MNFRLAGKHSTKWVWVLFVAAPLILACCYGPLVVYLKIAHGMSHDGLVLEMAKVAWIPSSVGFSLILLATYKIARRMGISLSQLGWGYPSWKDAGLGLLAGAFLSLVLNTLVYPLLNDSTPGFDPRLEEVPLLAATGMFAIAAISEDTLYRSLGLGVLKQRFGYPVALLTTSLFYSLLVPAQSWPLFALAFTLGLCLGLLRVLTTSIWPVVIAHILASLSGKLASSIGWLAN